MKITICGGGNAAHALAGILGAHEAHQVYVYAPFSDEARRWQQGMDSHGGLLVVYDNKSIHSRTIVVSADPIKVVPGSQLVLLALPAFAHEQTLQAIAPFLDEGVWVGALPARSGFDWCAREVLRELDNSVVLFGLQTLPWACRITHYGREVSILGTKKQVDLAVWPSIQETEIVATLEDLLDIPLNPIANFLSLTLAGTGQLIHPGIMFGLFHHWDGTPYPTAPLFYHGTNDETANILESLSAEVQTIRAALENQFPTIDLSAVHPLGEWVRRSYAKDIMDPSSLRNCFVTNRSYAGLKAPMQPTDDGLVPDLHARYLSEDIPFGLVVTRGIAELISVNTPTMDKVIHWAQKCLGKKFLKAGKLQGQDIANSRAPQRYGYQQLSHFIVDQPLVYSET